MYKRCLSCMQLLAFLVVQGVLYLENTSCNCPPPPRLGGSLGSSQSNDPANDSLRKKIEYLIKKTRQLHSDGSVFNMSLLQSDINSKNTYTLTLIFIIINNVYISLSCNPKNIYKEVLRTSTVRAALLFVVVVVVVVVVDQGRSWVLECGGVQTWGPRTKFFLELHVAFSAL